MSLISLDNVSLAYGLDVLLDKVKLQINPQERVCLIGRNGAGKSSLLKIIEGVSTPDSGTVWRMPQLKVARLQQELPQDLNCTVYEFVAQGLADTGKRLADYHQLIQRISHHASEKELADLQRLQHAVDEVNGWHFEQEIKTILERLELNPEQRISDLSGGWQRRAALAQALVVNPDVLLLDEPTNHLDIEAIQWLEGQLLSCKMTIVFITHDRALLQRLATRIIELDRGQLTSWPGDYQNFLRRKEEMLSAEAKLFAEFDKKLAIEERWIRQGIKARRTRNEGRVRALEKMRRERSQRRDVQGNASFNLNEAQKSGQLVVEAKNISHGFYDKTLIKDFSIRMMRGDRIGLLGPNGVGKSTLLNILLGKLIPDHGTLQVGTKLEVAYFDQLRAALDLEKSVMENVVEGSDFIEVGGHRKHVVSYLADFLFTPQRAMTPVKALSGGECNRLLLAKLFSKPSNLLVLDEPTNDLDIETLELLEDLLNQFNGTLLIVSHDRAFLDNVVTSTLVFEGNGKITEYIGGYQDWLAQQNKSVASQGASANPVTAKPTKETAQPAKKLNYKDQRELASLPDRIHELENQQVVLQQITSAAEFYQQSQDKIQVELDKLKKVTEELEAAYLRWEELENK